ncbi:hypothetical protein CANCADRAFT_78759 [Tortispora caseinolytica NRRL Y-17796]|uniref:Phosphoglycerate mutase n=1 Tax=Tortispora caseinolytica NRRL Y-17796 TaxID=767744 RepID=A0A1E4TJG3_9ASCO|nr:hypothetical protein CANCADRAFT_78759 [Tortispora caseinolytica NRRL Y-17796]
MPELQEESDKPCDTGYGTPEVQELYNDMDYSRLIDGWNSKTGFWAPHDEALDKRASWVRDFIRSRPEKNIAVVGHGGFFKYRLHGTVNEDRWYGNAGWSVNQFDAAGNLEPIDLANIRGTDKLATDATLELERSEFA